MLNIKLCIFGPQGSGKGTQANLLCDKFNLLHIELGRELRKVREEDTPLGRQVKELIDAGNLVPNEISFQIYEKKVREAETSPTLKGFIADGFPRNEGQLRMAHDLAPYDAVILLEVSTEESIKRLLKRAEIEHRDDDTRDAIMRRLEIYHRETAPELKEYGAEKILIHINGEQSVEDVFKEIVEKLSKELPLDSD